MLTKNIRFNGFTKKKIKKNLKIKLKNLLHENNEVIKSLSSNYQDNYQIKKVRKNFGSSHIRLIGSQTIYNFLKEKVKKKFLFIDNLVPFYKENEKKGLTNLIISKSGNTLETICNSNILIKKKQKNIFITENKKSYLFDLANKLKADIIYHNNFIGGRYSVLSEVGMLPAELMGLNPKKFRQLDNLIKKPSFLNSLINNVSSILYFVKKKKIQFNYFEL